MAFKTVHTRYFHLGQPLPQHIQYGEAEESLRTCGWPGDVTPLLAQARASTSLKRGMQKLSNLSTVSSGF